MSKAPTSCCRQMHAPPGELSVGQSINTFETRLALIAAPAHAASSPITHLCPGVAVAAALLAPRPAQVDNTGARHVIRRPALPGHILQPHCVEPGRVARVCKSRGRPWQQHLVGKRLLCWQEGMAAWCTAHASFHAATCHVESLAGFDSQPVVDTEAGDTVTPPASSSWGALINTAQVLLPAFARPQAPCSRMHRAEVCLAATHTPLYLQSAGSPHGLYLRHGCSSGSR